MSDVNLPSDNPLQAVIPASKRSLIYALFGLLGLVLGSVAVALIVVGKTPMSYLITTAVYNFLQPYFASLAVSHVNKVTQ